jgi:hypothetical protein
MKVAVCFWGLTRSLKYTIDSINKYIFDIFKKNNIEFRVFMHTYSVFEKYNNSWANEKNIVLDNEEYKLLNPDYLSIDNQEQVKSSIDFLQYRTQADPWCNNYETMNNFILAMYSKKQLLKLFLDNDDGTYTHFLMIRPDVRYLNSFDIKWLSTIKNNEIYVPGFGLFGYGGGSNGFNDRMAFTKDKKIFIIYNKLFDQCLDFSRKAPLHSETINKYNMIIRNIKITFIPFYFNRVRANGVNEIDVKFSKIKK